MSDEKIMTNAELEAELKWRAKAIDTVSYEHSTGPLGEVTMDDFLLMVAERIGQQERARGFAEAALRDMFDGLAKVARDTRITEPDHGYELERAARWIAEDAFTRLHAAAEDRTDYEALKRRQYDLIDELVREAFAEPKVE